MSDKLETHQHKDSKNKDNSLIKDTLELLEEGEQEIMLRDEYKNVTLVLGNTGSGKSTFTQWIAGDNSKLISIEVKEGTGEYIIEDNNRIGNSTVTSKTIFPELVIKKETDTAYYDCPGFSDTRSTSHDIATTYFIKKVLDFSERVKMIFVISHPSLRKGVDRQDFMKLLRHATDLVKDIDKFKNSIAIIATKVDNQYVKQGRNLVLVDDDKVIATIADFLQEVKQYLEQSMADPNTSEGERKFYDNAIKFIKAMLGKDGERAAKIGIFRRPDEPGPLNEIALLREGKTHVEEILYKKLNFIEKNKNDFGYTVSQKSKNDITDLVEEINKKLWFDVGRIAGTIQDYFRNSVEQMQFVIKLLVTDSTLSDVNLLEAEAFSSKFTSAYNITSDLVEELKNLTNPEELSRIITLSVSTLNIDISHEVILNIANQGKYISFLQVVSDKNFSTRPWAELFKSTLTYLSESRKNIQSNIKEATKKINGRIRSGFETIAQIVKEHYNKEMKSLEIQTLPDRLTRGRDILSQMAEEMKFLKTAGDLVKMFQDNSITHGIDIPKDSMMNITVLSKYIELLQIVSDEDLNISLTAWVSPFKDLISYLDKSEKWYKFLNDLYIKFSEYKIQKDRQVYNVANLEDWGKTGKAQGLAITTSTFQTFLNKLKDYDLAEYDNVKGFAVTEQQIEELNQVLTLTLKHKTEIQCSEPYVFIKGDYINIEEITNEMDKVDFDGSCKDRFTVLESGKFKFIHVFALKSIFVDRDISYPGIKLPITFIAPKWEIVETKKIDLSGTEGKSHSDFKAKDGTYSKRNGENGIPGNPGGSGGAFFGIAERIVNGESLTISANGGGGGSGQGGGYGYKGSDGTSPSAPSDFYCKGDYREIKGFRSQRLDYFFVRGDCFGMGAARECLPDRCLCKYKMFGTSGERGGKGGQGGRGGKGGHPGNITIFELNDEDPKILKHENKGKNGSNGNGGKGGSGGRNGDDVIVEYICTYVNRDWYITERFNNNYGQSGQNGMDGANEQGVKNPEKAISINEPAIIINHYKSYLRENLKNRYKKHSLNAFLDHLDSNKNVKNIYDTLGLVDELQHIEKQFHSLNQDVDFIPFYKSLLNRISEYAEHPKDAESSVQHKKTLGYLYTATLSRIFNLKDHSESNLIVDIKGFLEIVKRDIVTLKDLQKERNKAEIIRKHNENYKSNVDTKIEEAGSFVKHQILPEISNISTEIDKDIDSLVAETVELQKKAKEEKDALIKKKEELEKALAIRGLFSFFKVMGKVVSFLGPVGAAVGSVIDATTSVSQSLVLDNQQGTKLPPDVVSNLKFLGKQIQMTKNKKFEELNKLLKELSHETSDYPETLSDTSATVENIKNKLNNLDKSKIDFKKVQTLENELKKELERKEKELKDRKDIIDKKTQRALKVIEKFNQIAQLGSVLLDIFNNHKHDKEAIDALTDAIVQAEEKFQQLRQYEEEIYFTIAPLLQNMETNLQDVANNLDGKSRVSLDVSKWKVQSTLRDMKLQMQQFSQGFNVKDSLVRCIEKLEEVMTTLINVYDRMQSYKEQQNLSDYIADISSATASSVNVSDPKLVGAINNLEVTIRSNLVLKQYQTVINAFKQWVFPFASNYLTKSQLPSHLELNGNIEDLVSEAVKRIEDLKLKINLYKVSVKKGDQFVHTGDFNSHYFSTKPFFVWKNEKNKNVISKLLSGQQVVLRANVRDSEKNKDAIKFSVVEFYLKSKNSTMQSQLDDTLKGFDVIATHLGNSYYRYDDGIYLITSESQPIYRSYEINNYGEPVRKNEVFVKIREGDLMLSPFAAWEVKLINSTNKIFFHDLEFYKNKVDLELSGSGSYVFKSELNLNKYEYKAIQTYGHSDLHNESKSNHLHRKRSVDQVLQMNKYYMTSGAVSGMLSPINYVFNSIKMYVMSNLAISVSRVFVGREKILEENNKENKAPELLNVIVSKKDTEHDSTALSDITPKEYSEQIPADKLKTKEQVIEISSESIPPREKIDSKDDSIVYNPNPSAVSTVNDNFSNSTNPFLPNVQDVEHHIPSPQVPDINCSLLLADLITRSITGVKYESAIDESLLSPKQKLQRKMNECIVQDESDIKRNFAVLSEMEDSGQRQDSWFSSVKKYARLTFQFLGFVETESMDSYVHDIRYLFNSMHE
ncbi:uncharacterized protein TNCT_143661 [Trichonephila clavata]|uniref:Uncharacterized protein n=1 Tax=Trichonephila clavata TaxID=2740835 RepID=A0A8X6ICS6_TRICU|nr:uncharacterized protein TNCT_143661 [Trichonephila clavata]